MFMFQLLNGSMGVSEDLVALAAEASGQGVSVECVPNEGNYPPMLRTETEIGFRLIALGNDEVRRSLMFPKKLTELIGAITPELVPAS